MSNIKWSIVIFSVCIVGLYSCRRHRTPKRISFEVKSKPSRKRNEKASTSQPDRQTVLLLTNIVSGASSDNLLLEHTGFVVSYNTCTGTPSWVARNLTSEETTGPINRRDFDFEADPLLPSRFQIEKSEYSNSSYDRGHMCPAGDMEWSSSAMHDCHYMTNICPQVPKLNQIYWERLESACRRWANLYGSIYIVCGPIYNKENLNTIGREHKIAIPEAFFKVVITLNDRNEKGIGFIYQNNNIRQTMESSSMTISQVEKLTGYNFFFTLPDTLENKIESQNNLSDWK